MKSLYTLLVVAIVGAALPLAAHAGGYLSSYGSGGYRYLSSYGGGSFSGGNKLSAYGGGGYGGFGGYSVVNYGYRSAGTSPDTPHRSDWAQYNRNYQAWAARAYATPPCGAYHRNPLGCKQGTTRWNPNAQ